MPNKPKTFRPHGTPTQSRQRYDKARGSAAKRGYDAKWTKLAEFLKHQPEFAACIRCNTATDCVDHIVPLKGKDDPLRLDLSNLQPMCKACNRTKGKQEGTTREKRLALEREVAINARLY
jgi:5-methylcytosine-specific restriction protein A